jgi:hypothetical protein
MLTHLTPKEDSIHKGTSWEGSDDTPALLLNYPSPSPYFKHYKGSTKPLRSLKIKCESVSTREECVKCVSFRSPPPSIYRLGKAMLGQLWRGTHVEPTSRGHQLLTRGRWRCLSRFSRSTTNSFSTALLLGDC